MRLSALFVLATLMQFRPLYLQAEEFRLITYADGRPGGGIRQGAETGDAVDSPGDIFVFDQKLLAEDADTVIGRNAGYCIRTDPGAPDYSGTDHPHLPDDPANNYGQCTWSLVFDTPSGYQGSIVVSGRESDKGTSVLPLVGGTGDFFNIPGVLHTTPMPQQDGGILFRQELVFSRSFRKNKR
jgi:hypothetical protein